jgi:hypothetical protein
MGGDIDWNVLILGSEQISGAESLGHHRLLSTGEHHGFTTPTHKGLPGLPRWYAHRVVRSRTRPSPEPPVPAPKPAD